MTHSAIGPIASHLPEAIETNDQLRAEFPRWDMDLIYTKTGIRERHIAAPGETASDLGVKAAQRLFDQFAVDPATIDFLLFCTQTPDYPLPTTACLMQDRLGLPQTCGALDFNLGCSGFVYGLAMADGLIRSGAARRILLVTAETYSKYIRPDDRSLRTIFGDGAAATLVEASETPSLGGFAFGTDGAGANLLLVGEGGARPPHEAIQPSKRQRWPSPLFMDGPALVDFAMEKVPQLAESVLTRSGWSQDQIDLYLSHQATHLLLDRLRTAMNVDEQRMPTMLEDCGNTVSSTLPLLIERLRAEDRVRPGVRSMLIGFGVGLSWAGCTWIETWEAKGSGCGTRAA